MVTTKTRELVDLFLTKISSIGDTYYQHKEDLDYASFLKIQLELAKSIRETEQVISELKTNDPTDSQKIEEAQELRRLLKLVGTTIAWILLEFNRAYIRNFARGSDPGFISGKEGFKLEILALKVAFKARNQAAILHDITNCLRTGDLSIIGQNGISPLELKLRKKKRKLDRREIRQRRRGEIIREFYEKRTSDRILPGWKSVRHSIKAVDKHNWDELTEVIDRGITRGHGITRVEDCLTYLAFTEEIPEVFYQHLKSLGFFSYGCLDRHIDGLPVFLPFTCFDMPLKYKEMLLFRDVTVCVVVDLDSLCRIIAKRGYCCRVLKNSEKGLFEITDNAQKELGSMIVGYYPVLRMIYECMSVHTFIGYVEAGKLIEQRLVSER